MGVIVPQVITEDKAGGGQIIDGGLRFDSRKSQRLTRTPSSDGNRKTWTWSAWVKTVPGAFSASNHKNLFSVDGGGADATRMHMFIGNASDKLQHDLHASSPRISSSVYRDVSGWYHVVVKFDSTQSTARNQIAWYINGQQVVNWDTESSITQNNDFGINGAYLHAIGSNLAAGPGQFFDGLMSQVYLIDGQALDASYFGYTDPLTNTWRPKRFKPQATPNNGTTWSNYWSGGILGGYPATDSFDGNTATSTRTSGGTLTWTPPSPIPFTTLKLYAGRDGSPTGEIYVNGTNVSSQFGANASWVTVTGVTSPLTSIALKEISSQYPRLSAVEIDGVILLDNDTTNIGKNGFYLPLDGNTPIGQDQSGRGNNWTPVNFGGSNTIEKATGALPILNTDGGGKVARVGVRTDSNASSLVLALPLVGIKSDFSNAINSGTSNKSVTVTGATASTAQSIFYGSSYNFTSSSTGASQQYLDVSPFITATSNWTLEFWFYRTQYTNNASYILNDDTSGALSCGENTTGQISVGRDWYTASTSYTPATPLNTWTHFAISVSGGVATQYLNGVAVTTDSNMGITRTPSVDMRIGGEPRRDYGGNGRQFYGYLQDIRFYNGVAKYTQNFIPASTDPDILPDTPSGVAYSSNVALVPSTDGAVAFDGSGDKLTSNSTNFVFGTSSFTVEAFVYKNSTSAKIFFSQTDNGAGGRNGIAIGYKDGGLWLLQGNGSTWSIETTAGSFSTNKWVHIAVSRDYSATKTYYFIDGQLVYTYGTNINLSADNNGDIKIGSVENSGTTYDWDGFVSNLHVVNGTALYTSNFTPPTGPITSVANTKLLCCKSNSSATAADVTPGTITANGNAVASNFNPFTVNINTQRGQESGYCTWDPLAGDNDASPTPATFTNGNLTVSYNRQSSGAPWCPGTIAIPSSGKWYWECVPTASSGIPPATIYGISNIADSKRGGNSVNKRGIYLFDGQKVSNITYSSYASGFSIGDTVGIAVNMDSGIIGFYKNGIYLGNAFTDLISSGYTWVPFLGMSGQNSGTTAANFGQKPFKFPPPAGFQPLALANTPRPTIVRPDQYVGISTWTGNGASLRSFSSLQFKPDFVWIKNRSAGWYHTLYDSVRGAGAKGLYSSAADAEDGGGGAYGSLYGYLSSFDRNGFTLTTGSDDIWTNNTNDNYVAWAWKAGGNSNTYNINDVGYSTASAAGLTAGTITPTGASVNTKSGFSIIAYTGTGSSATVAHGLGKTPGMVFVKRRNSGTSWHVGHQNISAGYTMNLEGTTGEYISDSGYVNVGSSTSSVIQFTAGSATINNVNASGAPYIAYLWAEIPGFSKFGTYIGNGSTNFVNLGFRPRWIMMKRAVVNSSPDQTNDFASWTIYDTSRNAYNGQTANPMYANKNIGEGYRGDGAFTGNFSDIIVNSLSNGFYLSGPGTETNANTGTYIYAAFAETPNFNLYGGQANAR